MQVAAVLSIHIVGLFVIMAAKLITDAHTMFVDSALDMCILGNMTCKYYRKPHGFEHYDLCNKGRLHNSRDCYHVQY